MTKPIKSCSLEAMKLTKRQLQTPTDMGSFANPLTIGELTIDQLRVALYYAITLEHKLSRGITKALSALEEIAP